MEYPPDMTTLNEKALIWIQRFGKQVEQVRETGLSQPYLAKLFPKDKRGKPIGRESRINLDHIDKMADTRRVRPSDIVRDIESVDAGPATKPLSNTLGMADQEYIAWKEIFGDNPLRSRRVLQNIRHSQSFAE